MTIKKSNESRRKLLKSIAAGSGAIVAGKSLPESWNRPVVDSVMLPAHAQTSGVLTATNRGVALLKDESFIARIVDSFVSDASAGIGFETADISYCLNPGSGSSVDMEVNIVLSSQECAESYQFIINGLPVGGDPVEVGKPIDYGCSDVADSGSIFDMFSLIKPAHAGFPGRDGPVYIQVDEYGGGSATGTFWFFDIKDTFTLAVGSCPEYISICEGPCDK